MGVCGLISLGVVHVQSGRYIGPAWCGGATFVMGMAWHLGVGQVSARGIVSVLNKRSL